MAKKFLIGVLFLLIVAVAFNSCQKDESGSTYSNYNVRLVPAELAHNLAQRVSLEFLQSQAQSQTLIVDGFTTDIPNRVLGDSFIVPDKYGNPAMYIYNYTNDSGFVVISADVKHEPVCAYVTSGRFEQDTVPSMYIEWFDATVENVEMVREGTYDNTARANYAWYDLLEQTNLTTLNNSLRPIPIDDPPPSCDEGWITTVRGPLLNTTWGQWCTFNEQAPSRSCTNGCWTNPNAPTGCVATAMSQVLRYWAHPNQFGYNYVNMPVAQGNGEVQRMMRDAVNSVNMDWACEGSGADPSSIAPALRNVFNYSSASFANVNSGSYLTVKSNIDNGWPSMLGGCNKRRNRFLGIIYTNSECHRWVCDGYWQSQNHCYSYLRFHMNWGWHEAFGGNDFNGWFAFNLWNPNNRNYQYAQSYVYNIHP